ncbi:MAG: hypothetical protein AAF513_18450, partial [Pseudomonadota bacterium]
MFSKPHQFSLLTAFLPHATTRSIADDLLHQDSASALMWRARGTLLHEHWLKKWVPPISPGKGVLQMILPEHAVNQTLSQVVDRAKLNYQATGAVFCSPSHDVFVGRD